MVFQKSVCGGECESVSGMDCLQYVVEMKPGHMCRRSSAEVSESYIRTCAVSGQPAEGLKRRYAG